MQTRTWFHLGPVGDAATWQELDFSSEYWAGDSRILARPPAASSFLRSLPRSAQRDAIRTLRGRVLRTETYALDRTSREKNPYTVTENVHGVSGLPVGGAWPDTPADWQLRVFFPESLASRTTQWERGSDSKTNRTRRQRTKQQKPPLYVLLALLALLCGYLGQALHRVHDAPATETALALQRRSGLARPPACSPRVMSLPTARSRSAATGTTSWNCPTGGSASSSATAFGMGWTPRP